jgi:hypothetical protein
VRLFLHSLRSYGPKFPLEGPSLGRDFRLAEGRGSRRGTISRCGMQKRRFTRLTNGFSKKFDNHCHALALYFVWYNFVKLHKAHKLTRWQRGSRISCGRSGYCRWSRLLSRSPVSVGHTRNAPQHNETAN